MKIWTLNIALTVLLVVLMFWVLWLWSPENARALISPSLWVRAWQAAGQKDFDRQPADHFWPTQRTADRLPPERQPAQDPWALFCIQPPDNISQEQLDRWAAKARNYQPVPEAPTWAEQMEQVQQQNQFHHDLWLAREKASEGVTWEWAEFVLKDPLHGDRTIRYKKRRPTRKVRPHNPEVIGVRPD